MKYDQYNFVATVSSKSEELVARMNEVFEVKLMLAQHFIDSGYKFVIVSEDVVSDDIRFSPVFSLFVSFVPKRSGIVDQIDENHELSNAIVNVVGDLGYRCIVADESMMSDQAKAKIRFLPKEGDANG